LLRFSQAAAAATGSSGIPKMSYASTTHKQYQQQQYQHSNMQHNSKLQVSQQQVAAVEENENTNDNNGNITSSTKDCDCIACELDMFFHDIYDKDTSTLTMVKQL
jgi:hypothetical protein